MMNLGDVAPQSVPKMCLLSPPQYVGGLVNTRMFIPHVCHDAIGVLAAVSVATACLLPDSIAKNIAALPIDNQGFSVEHPSGEFTVNLGFSMENGRLEMEKSGVIRTARLLSRGEVFVPISF
jgi:4-oxalomesaconate tautomerase